MVSGHALNNSDSFIGFRGIEDLGGGLKAGFQLEQTINMETGENNNQSSEGSKVFSRSANIWIEGGFSRFKMGCSVTPSYNAMRTWSILDMANYTTIPAHHGYVGESARENSQFIYKTPSFGGFSAEVAFVTKGDYGNAKYDLNMIYADGPISAAIAYNKTQKQKANYALGAKYAFGNFSLSAGYYDSKSGKFINAPQGAVPETSGFSIGCSVKFDNFSIAAEIQRLRKNQYTYQG